MNAESADPRSDEELVAAAVAGQRAALELLLGRVRRWIYNLMRRMLLAPPDAEDATQEAMLKICLNLSKFDAQRAQFRTWAYRIAVNHAISVKRSRVEEAMGGFGDYAASLDQVGFEEIPAEELSNPETQHLVEEAKASCTMGMLICLDREQRIAFILGEIFGASDREAAEMLEISRDNFRQRLARARRDLYNFMENKCGLVKQANPCRCSRKTKGFIRAGWVDPANLRFAPAHLARIRELAEDRCELQEYDNRAYRQIFREQAAFDPPDRLKQSLFSFLEQMQGDAAAT